MQTLIQCPTKHGKNVSIVHEQSTGYKRKNNGGKQNLEEGFIFKTWLVN